MTTNSRRARLHELTAAIRAQAGVLDAAQDTQDAQEALDAIEAATVALRVLLRA